MYVPFRTHEELRSSSSPCVSAFENKLVFQRSKVFLDATGTAICEKRNKLSTWPICVFLLNPRSFRYIFPAQKQKGENKVFWMQQEQHSVKKEQDLNMTHLCLFVKPKEFVRDSFPAHKQKGSRHT
jgi:hypothetical protein